MKKIIICLATVVMLSLGQNLSAQTLINFGLPVTATKIGEADPTIYTGLFAGVSQNLKITSHFGFTPGIYYSFMFNDIQKEVVGANTHNKFVGHSLAIPAVLNFRLNISDRSCLYVFFGPEVTALLSAQQDLWIENINHHLTTNLLSSDEAGNAQLNRFNLGLTGGIGAKIDFLNLMVGFSTPLLNRYANINPDETTARIFVGLGLALGK